MSDGEYRMVPEHPGSCVPHDLFDLRAELRFITMDRASAAGRFVLLKWTTGKPLPGVGDQGSAFIAKISGPAMIGAAVEGHHGFHGLSFIVHAGLT
jgi:hypothetical protein